MAKNYFYNLLLTLANLLFPILSFPYVSRVLGPEGIGKVQFIFSFSQYFALVASIGIPVYGMQQVAKHRHDLEARSKVFSELIAIYLLSTVCLFLLYLSVIFAFPYFHADMNIYLAASLMVLLGFSYIDWLFTGMEEFKSIAIRAVLFKIIGLGLLYSFVGERSDFRIYLYIMMFSFLGNNILSFFLIRGKVRPIFSGLQLKQHLMPLFFILGTSLASSMYTDMDTVLLGFLSNDKTVGLYTAAVKLSKITIPFVTSMTVILMPKVSNDFAERNLAEVQKNIDQTFRFLIFFAVPMAFGLALLAPEFLALFSGNEFLPASNSMRLLSLLPLIVGFGHFFLYMVLVPAGRNKEMFFCVVGGVIVSLVLNVLLIPHFQEVGSSIANVCAEIVVTLLYVYFIKQYFSFTYEWSLLVKAILSSLIFIPLIWLTRGMALSLTCTLLISISGCSVTYLGFQWVVFRNNFLSDILEFMRLKFNIGAKP
ncbi:flippase [Pedobacter hartonius]|uniref:Membrane protein involved in the export of O-antigen and teichoic acid n=1 Tax=Pedobacter hartonius TaxID=425514 RepID=A0A1H4FQ90_9SPHI|nr:flippase [Pedobacter hartonius]SEA99445.1 Membrane protein involved in the export of O-antigen and teichoic acid [Pedobacter hartonius]